MGQDQFGKFKELLDQNFQFPCIYIHKIIGLNSDLFKASIAEFELKFIGLKKTTERKSASGKHLSLTYEYHAANADDVVLLMTETQKMNDLIYII